MLRLWEVKRENSPSSDVVTRIFHCSVFRCFHAQWTFPKFHFCCFPTTNHLAGGFSPFFFLFLLRVASKRRGAAFVFPRSLSLSLFLLIPHPFCVCACSAFWATFSFSSVTNEVFFGVLNCFSPCSSFVAFVEQNSRSFTSSVVERETSP